MPIDLVPISSSVGLITVDEMVAAYPAFADFADGEQANLINAASMAVNRECDRILYRANYDEFGHHPGRTLRIRVGQWPIISIQRLMADLLTVLQVQYSATNAVRGTIGYITSGSPVNQNTAGIQLNPVPGSPVQLLFSTYTTVQSLADAINARPGWSATVTAGAAGTGNYGGWLTADLNTQVGVQDAFNQPANIDAFVRDIGGIPENPPPFGSPVIRLSECFPDAPRYPDRLYRSRFVYGFGGNPGNGALSPRYGGVRVSYTAGYQVADVPPDIKQAVIETILFFKDRQLSPGAFSSKTDSNGVSYTLAPLPKTPLPEWICRMLAPHRRMEIA